MSEHVEQATAAPGEKRATDHQAAAKALADLRTLGVPASVLAPVVEWMQTHA